MMKRKGGQELTTPKQGSSQLTLLPPFDPCVTSTRRALGQKPVCPLIKMEETSPDKPGSEEETAGAIKILSYAEHGSDKVFEPCIACLGGEDKLRLLDANPHVS